MIEDGRSYGGVSSGIHIDCIGEVAKCKYEWTIKRNLWDSKEVVEEKRYYETEFRHVTVESLEQLTALHIKVMMWAQKQKNAYGVPPMVMISPNNEGPKVSRLVEGVPLPRHTLRFWELPE